MELLIIFIQDYILKFYYFHRAFSQDRNHGFCISFHAFWVYFLMCMNESNSFDVIPLNNLDMLFTER